MSAARLGEAQLVSIKLRCSPRCAPRLGPFPGGGRSAPPERFRTCQIRDALLSASRRKTEPGDPPVGVRAETCCVCRSNSRCADLRYELAGPILTDGRKSVHGRDCVFANPPTAALDPARSRRRSAAERGRELHASGQQLVCLATEFAGYLTFAARATIGPACARSALLNTSACACLPAPSCRRSRSFG